jgi:Prokaryotic membrane lipoprotein lipid attachment site
MRKSLFLLSLLVVLSGCSTQYSPEEPRSHASEYAATGGVVGAGVGSVTGLAIGASISNGDVAASTLLGTASGLGAGLAIGAITYALSTQSEIDENDEKINAQNAELYEQQQYIDSYRDRVNDESNSLNPDPRLREYQYLGQKLGNPYR